MHFFPVSFSASPEIVSGGEVTLTRALPNFFRFSLLLFSVVRKITEKHGTFFTALRGY